MTPKNKIKEITKTFGMKYAKAAKAINMSVNSFYKKINGKYPGYDFNDEDVKLLINFITQEAKKLN